MLSELIGYLTAAAVLMAAAAYTGLIIGNFWRTPGVMLLSFLQTAFVVAFFALFVLSIILGGGK